MFILCIVYGYPCFNLENRKSNTEQIGVHERLAVLISLGDNMWAKGMSK